jgi:hypothetical protein
MDERGKMEYKIKPFYGNQANDALIALDKKRRAKVEKAAGRPFSDEEWFKYKLMTMPKSGNK